MYRLQQQQKEQKHQNLSSNTRYKGESPLTARQVRRLARLEMPPPPLHGLTSRHTNPRTAAVAQVRVWPAWKCRL